MQEMELMWLPLRIIQDYIIIGLNFRAHDTEQTQLLYFGDQCFWEVLLQGTNYLLHSSNYHIA